MGQASSNRAEAETRSTLAGSSPSSAPLLDGLLEVKLRPPRNRPGLIERPRLVDLLVADPDCPLVVLSAPVGYGKSTLLAEWARRDGRRFAWVTLAPGDDAPAALFTLIGHAVGRSLGVDPARFNAQTPGISIMGQVVPRLVAALHAAPSPLVLVLGNVHELHDAASRDALDLLVDQLPSAVQLVVTSRQPVWLASSARRASRQVVEIGPAELAFDSDEVARLLGDVAPAVSAGQVERTVATTEGWAAGVYLSALALRRGGCIPTEQVLTVRAADTPDITSQFIRDEVLSGLPPDIVRFLRRVAVLDIMSGPLCDAVLEDEGSAALLQSISSSNLLVVPVDATGTWYRCHMLLRTALLDELARDEPDMIRALHARASIWWEAAGSTDLAIRHALAAGDTSRAARLAAVEIIPAYYSGRLHLVERWLDDIGEPAIESNPTLAVLAGWIAALTGRSADAIHWLDRVEYVTDVTDPPRMVPTFESNRACLRGFLCNRGVNEMVADGELATSLEPSWSPWRTIAAGLLGTARWMLRDLEQARLTYTESIDAAVQSQGWVPLTRMLSLRAVLLMDLGDWEAAAGDVEQARSVIETHNLSEYSVSATAYAAAARLALHRGDLETARPALTNAMRLRDLVSWASPWAAVVLRVQLANSHLALGDPRGARIILQELDEVLYHCPKLGLFNDHVEHLRETLSSATVGGQTSTLSVAELRLLPYLQTHLTLAEIAERLFVSRHTVATQAKSIYRKLAVATRGDAVRVAREIGLLHGDSIT